MQSMPKDASHLDNIPVPVHDKRSKAKSSTGNSSDPSRQRKI